MDAEPKDDRTAETCIDPTQAWYWTPAWQEGERKATEDIAAGRSRVFESSEDFLASFEE